MGGLLGGIWDVFLSPGRALWELWEALGSLLEPLGGLLEPFGGLLGVIWLILGGCWTHLGASWSALGASWEALGRLLGASWERLGSILELSCDSFADQKGHKKHLDSDLVEFRKTMKNTVRYCKNQGSEAHKFDAKSSWKASWDQFGG